MARVSKTVMGAWEISSTQPRSAVQMSMGWRPMSIQTLFKGLLVWGKETEIYETRRNRKR